MARTRPRTFTVVVDDDAAAWSELDRYAPADTDSVAGGVLVGDEDLVARIRRALTDTDLSAIRVAPPNDMHVFTETRDTAADVAAAMIYAGNGRAILSRDGWDVLYAALPDHDTKDDDESIAEIVY